MSDDQPRSLRTRRDVLKTTGAASALATTGLAGCLDSGSGGGGGSSDKLTITGVWSGGEEEDFQAVMDHVEQQMDVTLEYHPTTTNALLTNTLMNYESGVAPADIVVMPSPARIQSDGRNGHLATLGSTWGSENYVPSPSRVTADSSVYGAPFKMDIKPGFWYRKSFFNEHDLSTPGTYDEFLSLCDTISGIQGVDAPIASGNGTGWPLSDITEGYFLRQQNGQELQSNLIDGEASFTDDRIRTAFDEIKTLHERGYFSQTRNFSVQYQYFWDNALPLYYMGSFTPAQGAVKDPSDLGVFRLPDINAITSSVNWFTVPTYTEQSETAKEVVKNLISAEAQQVWVERGGFIASNTQVPQSAYQLEVMARLPQIGDEIGVVPDLDDALGNPFQQEFWAELKGLWASPDTPTDEIVQSLSNAYQETISN